MADHDGAAVLQIDRRGAAAATGTDAVRRVTISPARGWHRLFPWLVTVLVAQAAIVLARDGGAVAGSPPLGIAQGELLQSIYGLSARWSTSGLLDAWHGSPPGGAHPTIASTLASLVELFGGGGRLALLLPGVALLLASELAFAAAALRLTRSPALAALGLGLLLLRTQPWLGETGLFSANANWIAFCGVALATSMIIAPSARSPLLRACLIAAAGCVTLCASPTAFACLLAITALRLAIGTDLARPRPGTAVACVALAFGAVALLWTARTCPVGPATGISLNGGMVARCEYGLRTSLLYLASFDLGLTYILVAILSLGAVLACGWPWHGRGTPRPVVRSSRTEPAFLIAVLVTLACIQVARRSVNPIGSGLADVPLTALLLAVVQGLARRLGVAPRRPARLACFGCLALSPVLPAAYPVLDAPLRDVGQRRAASEVASWLASDAEASGRTHARILAASLPPLIDGPGLSAFFYETFGEVAAFTVTNRTTDMDLPGALDYAVVPAQVLVGPPGAALQGRLDATMVRRVRLDPQGQNLVVYSAPSMSVAGVSGDWLLATGTSLRFDTKEISADSVISLHGPDGYARYVPDPPTVTALATTRAGRTVSLPVRFVRGDDAYTILVDPRPLAAMGEGRADVALAFSRFFVPREVGLNQDPRKLAVMAPTTMGLAPRAAFDASPGQP